MDNRFSARPTPFAFGTWKMPLAMHKNIVLLCLHHRLFMNTKFCIFLVNFISTQKNSQNWKILLGLVL